MNSLRKTLAEKYGLVADIMHDDYFFVQLPENEDHSLKFLESNLPECIRVELAECFAGSVIAAWELKQPTHSTNTVYNWSGSKIKSGCWVKQCPFPALSAFMVMPDVITFIPTACF